MKVLVTGGSGYLGIHVRRFLDDFSRRSNLDILTESDVELAANYDVVIPRRLSAIRIRQRKD